MSDPQEAATPSDPHSAEADRAALIEFMSDWHAPDGMADALLEAGFTRARDAEVAELKAKIADAWDEGAQIGGRSAFFQTPNPYRLASSPVEGGN